MPLTLLLILEILFLLLGCKAQMRYEDVYTVLLYLDRLCSLCIPGSTNIFFFEGNRRAVHLGKRVGWGRD